MSPIRTYLRVDPVVARGSQHAQSLLLSGPLTQHIADAENYLRDQGVRRTDTERAIAVLAAQVVVTSSVQATANGLSMDMAGAYMDQLTDTFRRALANAFAFALTMAAADREEATDDFRCEEVANG